MEKVVKLSLEGQIDKGYQVELVEIREEGKERRTLAEGVTGNLPPADYLYEQYQQWQRLYKALAAGGPMIRELKKRGHKMPTNISVSACQEAADKLKASFNQWLSDPNFSVIDRILLRSLDTGDKIRFVIKTTDYKLWQLPWSVWTLFEEYPNVEVGFSPSEFKNFEKIVETRRRKQVRILALGGDTTGINYEEDQANVSRLKSVGADPEILNEPTPREFRDRLWNKKWDILFYSGHSKSEEDLQTGQIYLTNSDVLEPEDMERTLKKAIDNGLKMAIFNSCEGLGLARKLVEYGMPVVIVMREPVPNDFAQEFVKYFLLEYAWKKQPLYVAVRQAKERLMDEWRGKLPSIDWLPAICQNPAIQPPSWADLHRPVSVMEVSFATLACTSLVVLARFLGLLQPLELSAFDQLMRMRRDEGPDNRFLVVEVAETDLQELQENSLSDGTLAELLAKLTELGPRAIGLDLFRDIHVDSGREQLASQLRQNHIISICFKGEQDNSDKPPTPPPSESVPGENFGYSDVVVDPDGVTRRHQFSGAPQATCETPIALSTFLAIRYLQAENINPDFTFEGYLKLGNTVFEPLNNHTGFYHNIDDRGHQITLNYRSRHNGADSVTVMDVIEDRINANQVRDRVVLIGSAKDNKDIFLTPYGTGTEYKTPGVFIHAQMASQMIAKVKDGRPLIWFWPNWGDLLWICFWSLAGSLLVWYWQKPLHQRLTGIVALVILYAVCFLALLTTGLALALVPSALALMGAAGSLTIYANSQGRNLTTLGRKLFQPK